MSIIKYPILNGFNFGEKGFGINDDGFLYEYIYNQDTVSMDGLFKSKKEAILNEIEEEFIYIQSMYEKLNHLKNEEKMKQNKILEDWFIVRTDSAGVFFGKIESRNGREVVMKDARRLWYWSGASSLSQLAMEGVKNPDECKFPCSVSKVLLLEAIEILNVTEDAKKSIDEVPIWKQ